MCPWTLLLPLVPGIWTDSLWRLSVMKGAGVTRGSVIEGQIETGRTCGMSGPQSGEYGLGAPHISPYIVAGSPATRSPFRAESSDCYGVYRLVRAAWIAELVPLASSYTNRILSLMR